ncbi:hypothetical protein BCR32DRAFT_265561, partial [Anaeromyces robustus]
MVYIPVVPESVIESLQEAPITFIMGYVNSNNNSSTSLESLASINSDNESFSHCNNFSSTTTLNKSQSNSSSYKANNNYTDT